MVKDKNIKEVMSDNNYPSSVDNMVRYDTDFEGTKDMLPKNGNNPAFGADGKLQTKKVTKVR